MKKVMIVGDWNYQIYEESFKEGFQKEEWKVIKYGYGKYFESKNYLLKNYLKIELKYKIGIINFILNYKLKKKIQKEKPDLIFFYRAANIDFSYVKKLKNKQKFKIFIYNNDDPFSKKYPSYMWRKYFKLLKISDQIFSYRKKNIEDYKKLGYNNIRLLLPYYLEKKNFFLNVKKEIDVLFIGHFEDDGRDEYIKLLLNNNLIKFKLYGTGWEKSKYYQEIVSKNGEIRGIYDEKYNLEINKSKISLVFLSKINNDDYTRRNFEIPMAKSLVISEYTETLSKEIFEEQKTIECFKNLKEFEFKINYYIKNRLEREKIIECAYEETKSKHSNIHRVREIIEIYNQMKS